MWFPLKLSFALKLSVGSSCGVMSSVLFMYFFGDDDDTILDGTKCWRSFGWCSLIFVVAPLCLNVADNFFALLLQVLKYVEEFMNFYGLSTY